jgi:hypothetical protein
MQPGGVEVQPPGAVSFSHVARVAYGGQFAVDIRIIRALGAR